MELTLSHLSEIRVLRRMQETARATGRPSPKKVNGKAIQAFAALLPREAFFINRSLFPIRINELVVMPDSDVTFEELRTFKVKSFVCRFNNDVNAATIKVN